MIKIVRYFFLLCSALWLGLNAQDVKIMTFNVRVNVDGYPNDWNTRQWKAINMLKIYNPDVIGLQEDEWVHVNSLMQHIPGLKMATEVSTGIMYQSSKLRVIQTGKFWLSNTPDAPNGSFDWGQLYIRRVQWVIFENIADGKRFYVYNNHWDIVGPYARLKSAELLTSRIDTRQFPQYPVVVTGDMNAPEVEESIVHLKTKGAVKFRDTFRELYPNATNVGTFHGFGGGKGGPKIDFVLLQQGIGSTISSEIIHYNENNLYPTDHFPIIAHLSISGTQPPPPPVEQKPYFGTALSIPGTIEAEHFDIGGQNVSYLDLNTANNGNAFRNEGVDLENCSESGFNLGWTETGEWLEYTVDVKESGSYWLHSRVASNVASSVLQFELNGVALGTNVAVENTTGWQTWKTLSQKVNLTSGVKVLRIKVIAGGFNLNKVVFEKETVTPPITQQPYNASPFAIPGVVEAEQYDLGGSGVAFQDNTTANEGSAFRTDAVDIEACTEGGFNVGWMQIGEWLEYSVSVKENARYTMNAQVASAATSGSFQLELNGTAITNTLAVSSTGGWQNWKTISASGIVLAAGEYILRVKVLGSDFNLNKLEFVKEVTNATCSGAYLTDYRYTVSGDAANPSITFIPVLNGAGANMLILYYGTGTGALPGYRVYPNVPFKINASTGQNIRFYFTYSNPAGGERNSSASPHTVTVGSCGSATARLMNQELEEVSNDLVYPNPVGESSSFHLNGQGSYSYVKILNSKGNVVLNLENWNSENSINIENLAQGVYFVLAEKDGTIMKSTLVK